MKGFLLFLLCGGAALAAVVGDHEPSWQFQDLQGHTISSSDFKGKVVILDFWATWCGPCKREIPGYMALQRKYGAQGLVVLGVSIDGGPDPVRRYVDEHDVNYTVGMSNNQIYSAFNSPDVVPTTFLIDRNGIIRDYKVGGESAAAFEKKVVACLNGAE